MAAPVVETVASDPAIPGGHGKDERALQHGLDRRGKAGRDPIPRAAIAAWMTSPAATRSLVRTSPRSGSCLVGLGMDLSYRPVGIYVKRHLNDPRPGRGSAAECCRWAGLPFPVMVRRLAGRLVRHGWETPLALDRIGHPRTRGVPLGICATKKRSELSANSGTVVKGLRRGRNRRSGRWGLPVLADRHDDLRVLRGGTVRDRAGGAACRPGPFPDLWRPGAGPVARDA